jgi:energy-coupling factor transporter ATP-binding protein EcfA2
MQNYELTLKSDVSKGYRCQRAADSLDIDSEKKSVHHFKVSADLGSPYNVGLIVGASGSGKTTLAEHIWGKDCFKSKLDLSKPVIEQFPEDWDYDACSAALAGMGLTSVPCWIRPAYTLSNGQRARAEAALQLATGDNIIIDEWTSVVDRTVAKVMSHCVAKYARKSKRRVTLVSCHYDVIDWLNPDWVIDCNKQTYTDRRAMVGTHERTDRLRLDIRRVDRKTWPYFSKYHYLSERLPGGAIHTYGLFQGVEQIGFQCFAAYIIGDHMTFFSNRTVIHPDYAGLGLGIHLINETSKDMVKRGFRVKAKFSSIPVYKAMSRQKDWKCTKIAKPIKRGEFGLSKEKGGNSRAECFRTKTTTYHFDFTWTPPREFTWRQPKEELPEGSSDE